MGGGSAPEVRYVGPTKEELAQKQAQYDETIRLLQEQNLGTQTQYDRMRQESERALAERTSLMQQELERQRKAYEETMTVTKTSLEKSQQAQQEQAKLMADATAKQEQALKIQNATVDKETTQAREAMDRNRRTVDVARNTMSRRRRNRGLLSSMSSM